MDIFLKIYCSGYFELIFLFVSLSLLFSIINKLLNKYSWYKICCAIAFALYLIVILYATILNRENYPKIRELSLIPFASYKIAFNGNEEGFRTCFMNALLFFPLGCAFYGFNSNKKIKIWYFVLFTFGLSLIIEIVQYAFCLGSAEVDDLIHNTLGAVLAYFICCCFNKIINLIINQTDDIGNLHE